MKNIADLKRALTEGTVIVVSDHKFPDLNGERTVLKAQTQRIKLSMPADHPRAAEVDGSWFEIPKKDGIHFEDGSARIVGLMTITVKS